MIDALRSLRTSHRTVLAMIAACALVCWMQPNPPMEGAPDPIIITVAVVLGLGVILLRGASGSPVIQPGARTTLLLSAWACGFGLALLGTFLAVNAAQPRTGLAFALAAGLFCLRPPPATAAAQSPEA